jgi:5'-nucleotidase
MAYPIEKKLVVAVSSNALFDLEKEDDIYQTKGLQAYKDYQIKNRQKVLNKGNAFPFIRRFLNINKVYSDEKPVEVVLLSKNSPITGIRVFNSIKAYDLDISRAAFTSGKSPFNYIPAYNISLFLSTNETDVINAIETGLAAGRILKTNIIDDSEDMELRVAFDFDGVIADDEAEKVYKESGSLEKFYEYETEHKQEPLNLGPLGVFFKKLSFFQKLESKKEEKDKSYKKILKTAIITARSAPAHERAINTLRGWDVEVDEMFLLGGIEKKRILEVFKPQLFFDDQLTHLDNKIKNIPLVHIPFGIANKREDIILSK